MVRIVVSIDIRMVVRWNDWYLAVSGVLQNDRQMDIGDCRVAFTTKNMFSIIPCFILTDSSDTALIIALQCIGFQNMKLSSG